MSVLTKWLKKIPLSSGLKGDYQTWKEACDDSTGYNLPLILERTKESALKVVKGEAVYERDSVLFNEVQYSWQVLSGLMWVAAKFRGILHVLDFGGSLGSTYYQNYEFLRGLSNHRWGIVEQPEYVRVGKETFENEYLSFHESTTDYLTENVPNVILCSSSLQYLESPEGLLFNLAAIPSSKYILIDKTPFWNGDRDWLCVQKVPAEIYPASYPSWIFSKDKFILLMNNLGYRVMVEWKNPDTMPAPIEVTYQGMILVKK
jgi:putative methyltransferase (TIGR04325 family)